MRALLSFVPGALMFWLLTVSLVSESCCEDLQARCPARDPLKCPDNWFPVDDKCFTVHSEAKNFISAQYNCSHSAAVVLEKTDMSRTIRACIYGMLWYTREPEILVGNTEKMNVATGQIWPLQGDSPYACLLDQSDYSKLSIKMYRVKYYGSTGERTVDLSSPMWSQVGMYQELRPEQVVELDCKVQGKPFLWWALTLGRTGTSERAISFQVNKCGYLGTFTCHAETSFEQTTKSIELYSKCDSRIADFKFSPGGTISSNNDLSLVCVVEGYPPPIAKIVATDARRVVKVSHSSDNPNQLTHQLGKPSCDLMGTNYYCQATLDGQVNEKPLTLWINNCPPVLCPGEEKRKRVYGAVGDTVNLSFCLLAYPDLQKSMHINSYWTENHRRHRGFYWQHEKMPHISDHAVKVTLTLSDIRPYSYGEITLNLWTTEGYNMEYVVDLIPQGPPTCPDHIRVIARGSDYIGLSWQPGFDGGASQSFHVYYTTDNVTWRKHETVQDTWANVTGLQEDTAYTFRVVASNRLSPGFNETTCNVVEVRYRTSV